MATSASQNINLLISSGVKRVGGAGQAALILVAVAVLLAIAGVVAGAINARCHAKGGVGGSKVSSRNGRRGGPSRNALAKGARALPVDECASPGGAGFDEENEISTGAATMAGGARAISGATGARKVGAAAPPPPLPAMGDDEDPFDHI